MFPVSRSRLGARVVPAFTVVVLLALLAFPVLVAYAATLQIGVDPFTQATCHGSATTNHHANVEPDSFSNGSTIVAAYQVGRIYDGGACAIGFSTSTDNGATWTSGLLPGLTKYTGGGTFDRATDPAVAYDAQDNVWMISSLVLTEAGGVKGVAIYTSRSTDGGFTWGTPVLTNNSSMSAPTRTGSSATTPRPAPSMATATRSGTTTAPATALEMSTLHRWRTHLGRATTNNAGVIGGQPVVRPNGTVIVPTANANETAIGAFNSTNGGASWSAVTTIATIRHHTVAGSLREGPLPSAEIDGAGTVYVVWADCRFRQACRANDIVICQSLNATGTSWSAVTRVPIDATNSGIDHFIPGLAVNKATSGATAQLGLTYYFYPQGSTQLSVGFISSATPAAPGARRRRLSAGCPQPGPRPPVRAAWSATTSPPPTARITWRTASLPALRTTDHGRATCSRRSITALRRSTPSPLAWPVGALSAADDPVLFSGNGGANANSLWNIVDNNGIKHRD